MNAVNIVTSKYFRGAVGTPQREVSLRQLIDRIVKTYRKAGEDYKYFASPADAEMGVIIPAVITDVLDVMRRSPRMYTVDLLAGLVNLDEDTYGDWDAEKLAYELDRAGVTRASKQVKIEGKALAGYQRRDIEGAVPVELLAPVG